MEIGKAKRMPMKKETEKPAPPQLQLYDKLVQFSLFQGISSTDMADIAANYKLGFRKVRTGELIAKAGQRSVMLLMIAGGQVEITRFADNKAWMMTEVLTAPHTIEPHRLFGLNTELEADYVALTDTNIIYIYKEELRKLISQFEVIRINILNLLAHTVQKFHNALLMRQPEKLDGRIIKYIKERCIYPAGRKVMKIKMTQLAEELNDSRLDISRALNDLSQQGMISLHRGTITIEAIEKC